MRIVTCTGIGLAMALASGCSTMHSMMGGEGGEKVTLSGANEVPAVDTSAKGNGTVTVGADCSVKADIKVSGMTATAAHIHQGAPGANGKVLVPFVKQGDDTFVAPEGAKLDAQGCADYRAGRTYVNVHSDAHKGGEIRAPLKGTGGHGGA
jgi:CHRD domain